MSRRSKQTAQAGKGRRAAFNIAGAMLGVALVAVLVIAMFDFVAVRNLLYGVAEAQMEDVAASRGARIENGLGYVEDLATTMASDKGTVWALKELSQGYAELDRSLEPAQQADLRSAYQEGLDSFAASGAVLPTVDELLPASDRAQYLQYWYLAQNPFDAHSELDDAGDGSAYSSAHAAYHPTLRAMAETTDVGDLLLVDAAKADVVYSVDKRIDFGTSLVDGPYKDSSLAEIVLDHVRSSGANEAVLIDFEPYVPAGGEPLLFAASAVRDEGRVIGALVLEIPNAVVTSVTTANQDWEGTGLGATGEAYIVGGDGLMRSSSRLWLEDPAAYLDALPEAGYSQDVADLVVLQDNTVLAQPVDTEAVATALDGDEFVGITTNYLGRETVTVARPLNADTMDWVVVADLETSEAQVPLARYARSLGVLALVLLPAVALFAAYVSRKMLLPVATIEDASERVSENDLTVRLPIFGRDEYGDVAEKFNDLVETLCAQQEELVAAEAETNELLVAVMPSQLAEEFLSGNRDIAEAVSNATLIAMTIVESGIVVDPTEQEALADRTVALSAGVADLAERFSAQLLHSSAEQLVYATGLGIDDQRESEAVSFVMAVRDWVETVDVEHGVPHDFRAGLSSGDVVVGIVGTDRSAFAVWGAPRRRAVELASVARPGDVLADATSVGKLGDGWSLEPMTDLVSLDGERLDGWRIVGPRSS